MNGLELIERVRSMFHREYVPIVMMSGTLDEAAARKAGANAFLRKPQDIGLLVETVNRLLDDSRGRSPRRLKGFRVGDPSCEGM